jgi:hypothetical protein
LAYFVLEMPLIMAVVDTAWIPASRGKARLLAALFTAAVVAHILPHIPGLELLRDLGLGMYAALFWWAVAWLMVSKDKYGMATRKWGWEEVRSAA